MIRLSPLALLVCAACAPTGEAQTPPPAEAQPPATQAPAAPDPETGAQCDATKVQALVGRTGDAATVEQAKQGSGARTLRRYNTGDMLTQDLRVDRVNVEIGPDGKIVKIACG